MRSIFGTGARTLFFLAVLGVAVFPALAAAQTTSFCASCVSVVTMHPVVARSAGDEPDQPFNEVSLPSGGFRGFSAAGTTYAISGPTIYQMNGPRTAVLTPGQGGAYSSCGNWLNGTFRSNGVLWGLVDSETDCNYSNNGETYGSMAIGQSSDNGLTWNILGQVFTGSDGPTHGAMAGEGNGTMVHAPDGYMYAYVMRQHPYSIIAARASDTNLSPSQWHVWDGSGWSSSSLGGTGASLLGYPGSSVGWWSDQNVVADINGTDSKLQLSFSTDKVHFQTLASPFVSYDADNWTRPQPTDLYAYPSIIAADGSNVFSNNHFTLSYMYLPPGGTFANRYLVMSDVYLTMQSSPVTRPNLIELARWVDTQGIRWTTTGPSIGFGGNWSFDKSLGYLMTAQPTGAAGIQLEECESNWPGHPDFLFTNAACGTYTTLRSAGWAYQTQQPGTAPLYRCYSNAGQYHFASTDAACEGLGTQEWKLGYVFSTSTPPVQSTSCTWNNQTVASGSSVTAWQSSSVANGQTCQSQQRTCSKGMLSGSYTYPACTVQTASGCSFNSQTIASGSSVTAWQSSSVANGQQCVSQRRTCSNGTLSGSYTNISCTVQSATTSPSISNVTTAPTNDTLYHGGNAATVSWSATNVSNVYVDLYQNGTFVKRIGSASASTIPYTWTTTNGINVGSGYTIRVTDSASPSVYAESPAFSVNAHSVSVSAITPTSYTPGSTVTIRWKFDGLTTFAVIYLLKGGVVQMQLTTVPASDNSYTWTIPISLASGSDYAFRVISRDGMATADTPDTFTIATSNTAPASCTFNNQTIASGSSVTAWQSSSVAYGKQCVSQNRTCTNGTLSGSYTNASCTVQSQSTSQARDAARLSDMQTISTALALYAKAHGNYPSSIPGGVGTWGGWECGNKNGRDSFMPYLVSNRDISQVPEETFWPGTGGNTWTECTYRYFAPVAGPTACGSTSGNYAVLYMELENPAPASYKQPACWASMKWGEATPNDPNGALLILPMQAQSSPASCTFNSQTVASGSSVTAYQASSVSAGSQCVSQNRTCTNGTLSGSYTNASCTVQGAHR